MKIGLIKERKTPPDRRVVFSPHKLFEIKQKYPELEIVVEASDIRVFSDSAYEAKGVEVTTDLQDCDLLLGVKEVPVDALIPNKQYFFFSHTIKEQPYNRDLLRAILEKKITLYDHETVVDKDGARLIGFGRYAGIVGTYNGFRAYGIREKSYDLPKVESLTGYKRAKEELKKVKLPREFKILLTGVGKVARGAIEILRELKIKKVSVKNYLNKTFDEPVFCQIDVLDYNKRKDGKVRDNRDFYKYPQDYKSDFFRFARVTDYYIAGHFYGEHAPLFFTRDDAKREEFKINLIADISCDINGPVASTIRPSTIDEPLYGYDPLTEKEVPFGYPGSIGVMAVDNLPCELPKNASEGFGEMFAKHVIPAFFNGDKDGILSRAKMTENGKLTPQFSYLQGFVEGVSEVSIKNGH